MLVLMFVGLFTSRVVLAALGETDYGVYNAVGGMVTVFTFVTTSISAAISRYLAFEIARGGDSQRLRKVFSAGIAVQLAFAMILILLAETLGQWFLHSRMNIPLGREGAAEVVLQCSLAALVIQLLSVPYNAAIIAHEKMSAFAVISFLEAGLKLSVALVVKYAMCDKLILYAVLVAAVSLLVRMSYGLYCRKRFPESRGRLLLEPALAKEMLAFSGWNFFGSSAYVLNTQGVTVLVNIFFGIVGTFWLRTQSRRAEIGLRAAVGASKAQLRRELFLEGLFLLALTLPFLLIFLINMLYLDMPDTYRLAYTWWRFLITLSVSYLLMGGMIYLGIRIPANKITRMNPAETLHYE